MNRIRAAPKLNLLALCGLLLMLTSISAAHAESGAYRIEILVFHHNLFEQPPEKSDELHHFAGAWRLFEERSVIYPEDPAPLGVISDGMSDVWERLERSEKHQPLHLQAWEQSRIDYHPPVRIHDDRVIHQHVLLPERWADIDLTKPDFFSPYRETYFRLDGTAQLRRSRFLHLEFELEFRLELLPPELPEQEATPERSEREPAIQVETPRFSELRPDPQLRNISTDLNTLPNWNPPIPLTAPMPDENLPLPGVQLYRLQESRQIRTGELLYYDTPFLGVIARVTATTGQ